MMIRFLILRLSLDAKARVSIGSFDRGGRNRVPTETDDHETFPDLGKWFIDICYGVTYF